MNTILPTYLVRCTRTEEKIMYTKQQAKRKRSVKSVKFIKINLQKEAKNVPVDICSFIFFMSKKSLDNVAVV